MVKNVEALVDAKCMNGLVQHLHTQSCGTWMWRSPAESGGVHALATNERPVRKDMQNLSLQLDFDATRALLLGKTYPGSSHPSRHSPTDSAAEPQLPQPRNSAAAASGPLSGLERHRLRTILSASVRTNRALATREDRGHLF